MGYSLLETEEIGKVAFRGRHVRVSLRASLEIRGTLPISKGADVPAISQVIKIQDNDYLEKLAGCPLRYT
jgi:hypothetical protein